MREDVREGKQEIRDKQRLFTAESIPHFAIKSLYGRC